MSQVSLGILLRAQAYSRSPVTPRQTLIHGNRALSGGGISAVDNSQGAPCAPFSSGLHIIFALYNPNKLNFPRNPAVPLPGFSLVSFSIRNNSALGQGASVMEALRQAAGGMTVAC